MDFPMVYLPFYLFVSSHLYDENSNIHLEIKRICLCQDCPCNYGDYRANPKRVEVKF